MIELESVDTVRESYTLKKSVVCLGNLTPIILKNKKGNTTFIKHIQNRLFL